MSNQILSVPTFFLQVDMPGDDGLDGCMQRWRLLVKLPSALEKALMTATSRSNTICGYFHVLEEQIKLLNIQ